MEMKRLQFGRRQFLFGAVATSFACGRADGGTETGVSSKANGGSLRIAHLCDPQFGFTTGLASMKWRSAEHYEENYKADLERCARAIDRINELQPDLVLFGGDMTQRPSDVERDWPVLLARLNVPWMVTPGNHDMGNRVTQDNLSRFRKVFGKDREARDIKGWRVIAGNSQFWYRTDAKDEQNAYEKWLREELESAKAYNGRVIVASHIPPFAFIPDEKDSYNSCPISMRFSRLDAYAASGARFYLAAHQHRLVVRGYKGMTILSGEAMCDNFDKRPTGFRMFEVNDDFAYSWNFIKI